MLKQLFRTILNRPRVTFDPSLPHHRSTRLPHETLDEFLDRSQKEAAAYFAQLT